MKTSKRKFLFAAMLALGVAASGCSNEGDDSVTNPGASTLRPTGTVQGVVMDSVTQQPIVGAVVDIDGNTATTNGNGQYSLHNVPATTDALNGTVEGSYTATINLKNARTYELGGGSKIDVNMATRVSATNCGTAAAAKSCYPDFAYNSVSVSYTSLNDTTDDVGGEFGGGTESNHDTPVTGLSAQMDVSVGKLDATITGIVVDVNQNPIAGATVDLYSNGSPNDASGASRHLVNTTATLEGGTFSFSNVEAFRSFTIEAMEGSVLFGTKGVTAPADGKTLALNNLQANPTESCNGSASLNPCYPVTVQTQDANPPFIVSATPENNADLDPTAVPLHVTYTFSEPIAITAYSAQDDAATADRVEVTTIPGATTLANDLTANFIGNKAGNIAHSIYWTDNMTKLHVEIPALSASSRYVVNLGSGAVGEEGNLRDSAGLPQLTGNNAQDPNGLSTINFSTFGGSDVATPVATIVNSANLDNVGTPTVLVDWLPISGAKEYNVYFRPIQVWQDGTEQRGALVVVPLVSPVQTSNASVPVVLDEDNEIALHYEIQVAAVNSDGAEGAKSVAVTAEDNVGPSINGATPIDADGDNNIEGIIISFGEPLRESAAETVANYTLSVGNSGTAPAIASAVYNSATFDVTLTFASELALTAINDDEDSDGLVTDTAFEGVSVGSGVVDLNGNSVDTDADQVDLAAALPDGVLPFIANALPIISELNIVGVAVQFNEPVNAAEATDASNYAFSSGATGADTTIASVTAGGLGPNSVTVNFTTPIPGADISDDEGVPTPAAKDPSFEGLTVSGIHDGAGNLISVLGDQVDLAATIDAGSIVINVYGIERSKKGIK